jgi:hypothetical protein
MFQHPNAPDHTGTEISTLQEAENEPDPVHFAPAMQSLLWRYVAVSRAEYK